MAMLQIGDHPRTEFGPLQWHALFFIRSPRCPFGKAALQDIFDSAHSLIRLGWSVMIISQTPSEILDCATNTVPGEIRLYADPEGTIQRLFHIGQDKDLTCSVKGLFDRSLSLTWALKALTNGVRPLHGPARQLGAEFLIDGKGAISYARYSCAIWDRPHTHPLIRQAKELRENLNHRASPVK